MADINNLTSVRQKRKTVRELLSDSYRFALFAPYEARCSYIEFTLT